MLVVCQIKITFVAVFALFFINNIVGCILYQHVDKDSAQQVRYVSPLVFVVLRYEV